MLPANFGDMAICDRFWRNVEIRGADDCWPWKLRKSPQGYGQFYYENKKSTRAHRAALMLSGWLVPTDKLVLHKCNNPPCCNPNHLAVGDNAENMRDRRSNGMVAGGWCFGSGHGRAILDEDKVRHIRGAYPAQSMKHLAAEFGVSLTVIKHTIARRIWKHV